MSYSRRDNSLERLHEIVKSLDRFGEVYIDDLHYGADEDRELCVLAALENSDAFLAVETEHYLRTPWTNREMRIAQQRGLQLFVLHGEGAEMTMRAVVDHKRISRLPGA